MEICKYCNEEFESDEYIIVKKTVAYTRLRGVIENNKYIPSEEGMRGASEGLIEKLFIRCPMCNELLYGTEYEEPFAEDEIKLKEEE